MTMPRVPSGVQRGCGQSGGLRRSLKAGSRHAAAPPRRQSGLHIGRVSARGVGFARAQQVRLGRSEEECSWRWNQRNEVNTALSANGRHRPGGELPTPAPRCLLRCMLRPALIWQRAAWPGCRTPLSRVGTHLLAVLFNHRLHLGAQLPARRQESMTCMPDFLSWSTRPTARARRRAGTRWLGHGVVDPLLLGGQRPSQNFLLTMTACGLYMWRVMARCFCTSLNLDERMVVTGFPVRPRPFAQRGVQLGGRAWARRWRPGR